MDHPRPNLRYVDADDVDDNTIKFDGLEVDRTAGFTGADMPPRSATTKQSDAAREAIRASETTTDTAGESSPHVGGRAQPGDVLGVETGGERTYVGDTSEDENKRRRDAEEAARKTK